MNSELLISIVNQVIYVPIRHHYKCRAIITYVVRALQISLFMQNKANFVKAQMNVNKAITRDYENRTLSGSGKNKANSKPIKANLLNAQMNVNKVLTKDYENKSNWAICENKPNIKPKQTQTNPISKAKKCYRCCTSFVRVEITNRRRSLRPWVLMFFARLILVCRVSENLFLLCRRQQKDTVRFYSGRAGSRGAL